MEKIENKRRYILAARLSKGKIVPDYFDWLKWLSYKPEQNFKKYKKIYNILKKIENGEATFDEQLEAVIFFEVKISDESYLEKVINSKFSKEEKTELNKIVNDLKKLSEAELKGLVEVANDPEFCDEFTMSDQYVLHYISKYLKELYYEERNRKYQNRRIKGGVLPRRN